MEPESPESEDVGHAPQSDGGFVDLRDIPLDVTVELGRTRLPLAEVLELAPGAVIDLDKMAGTPLDVRFNGRLIARGEAVVVGERFGVRITSIVSSRGQKSHGGREE
ncbi:MAG: flagellar motor switch protein FliN [Myxococcota bacterium]